MNLLQVEILFLYLLHQKIKKSDKYGKYRIIYEKYILDMHHQGIKKHTSIVIMSIVVFVFFLIFFFLIIKTPFVNFIKLVIGLNEIILKDMKLLIPCLFFLISFYFEVKFNSQQNLILIQNKLKIIIRSFLLAVPIFVIFFLIRYFFVKKDEEAGLISSSLLSINLSLLINFILFKINIKDY